MEDKYLQEDFVQKIMSAQSLNSTGYYKPHRQKNTKLELLCARIIGYIPTCFGYYRCAIGSVLGLCGYVGQTTAVKPRAFSGQSLRGDGH